MIDPKEFRIGNWFQWSEYASMGQGIDQIMHGQQIMDYINLKDPIPLTPEILEMCGFRKGEKWFIHQVYYNGQIDINVNRKGIHYGKKTEHGFDATIEIRYLHQLQNLYFALTGKELTVNHRALSHSH